MKKLTWDKLPSEIQNRMLKYQEEQGNSRNPEIFKKIISSDKNHGAFDWKHTKEGFNFWVEVLIEENFKKFYERCPKKDLSILIDNVINKLK